MFSNHNSDYVHNFGKETKEKSNTCFGSSVHSSSTLHGNLLLKNLVALSLDRLYQKRAFDSAPSLKTRLRMRPEEYTFDVDAEGRASVLKAMSCCLSAQVLTISEMRLSMIVLKMSETLL